MHSGVDDLIMTKPMLGSPPKQTSPGVSWVSRRRFWLGLVIFGLGWSRAILQVHSTLDRELPFSIYLYGDSELYLAYSQALVQGYNFDSGLPFHPPLPAWILALLTSVGPVAMSNLTVKTMLGSLCGAMAMLTYLLTIKATGSLLFSSIAGCAAAFSFGLAVIATVPGTEAIYVVITSVVLVLLADASAMSLRRAGLCGFLTGLGCLSRGEHLLFFPVIIGFIALRKIGVSDNPRLPQGTWRIAWRPATACMVGLTAVLIPNALDNYRLISDYELRYGVGVNPSLKPLPRFVPVTLYGPLNFALANMPPAAGEFTRQALPLSNDSWSIDPADSQHRTYLIDGYSLGLRSLLVDPLRAVRLWFRKLRIAWGAMSLGFSSGNFPSGLQGIRRPVDLFAPTSKWFGLISTILTVIGFYRLRQTNPRLALLLSLVVIHRVLTITAFYGYVRQGILLAPLSYVVLIAGFDRAPLKRRFQTAIGIGLGASCMVGLCYELHAAQSVRNFTINYSTIPGTNQIDHQQRIEFIPKP